MIVRRICWTSVGLLVLLAFLNLAAGGWNTATAQTVSPPVVVVEATGAINPPLARYLTGAIDNANRTGAAAVVILLDTPGGLMSSSDEIIRSMLESDAPIIVYVAPKGARAASAGVFITYAANIAAMAPGTRIGSASPVLMGENGVTGGDETMTRKITNDAVSQIKSLASERGRNATWAESAVRDAANITAEEAVQEQVVDLIAPDLSSLLTAVNGRKVQTPAGAVTLATAGAPVSNVAMTWIDELLSLIADPTIAYLLLSLGGVGLFLELSNPGATAPGVFGVLAVVLGLFGLGTLPVNWTGVLLIGFAFVLFIADIYLPSLGALTIGGLVSFVLGSYLLIGSNAPPGFEISRVAIWTMTALLVGFFVVLAGAIARTHFMKSTTGREGLIGSVGVARNALAPDGMIFAAGELWTATAGPAGGSSVAIPAGSPVVIQALDGLRAIVRRATADEAAKAGVAVLADDIIDEPAPKTDG